MSYDLEAGLEKLKPLLREGRLVIFVGSGVSVDSGLPTWDSLLTKFIDFCRDLQKDLPDGEQFLELLEDAEKDRGAYPIRVASVLKRKLKEIQEGKPENVYKAFSTWFSDMFASAAPNSNHHLIVGTNYSHILTSNYDILLEKAARIDGFSSLFLNSYNFHNADKVAAAFYERRPSIIHIHGDVNDIALDDFVFTAEDYMHIKRKYPGFSMALQSLFISHSVLFVGYGGSDPHLEDFVEEVSYLLEWSNLKHLPRYFLVLKRKKDRTEQVLAKYKSKLRTDLIMVEEYGQMTELLTGLKSASPRAI